MSDELQPPGLPQEEPSEAKKPSLLSRTLDFAGELLHVVIISLAIIIPVRYFLIQPFYVKGASMEPNFYDHEYLIIDELGYRLHQPERGEIVVFRYPNDPRQYFIKRIVGLPGERVKVSGGQVWIYNAEYPDGKVVDEKEYLGPIYTGGERDVQLAADEYFLMGDNRGASLDSRSFGPVPRSFIVGRVWFRGWPPEKIKVFSDAPESLK
ncbi:MAG TPA: signal peptidase I [Candidatus Eisenbacteria bacterium]|jgi:signal peptidase I|nr:signal peptidase I [Candidatus Eisenbacteria bacterium]